MARVELHFGGEARGAVAAARETRTEIDKIERSARHTSNAVEKDMGRMGRGVLAGSGAFRSLGRSVAFASSSFLGGAGLAFVLKDSISKASDLHEQMNKVDVVFGRSARSVKQWSKDSATGMGVAQSQALEFAGTFGNLLRPMGVAPALAATMSKSLVQLSADMASFNNASPEDTLRALQSGLTGQVRPLRQFGVFLDQARIKAVAATTGIVKANVDIGKVADAEQKVAIAQAKLTRAQKEYGPGTTQVAAATVALHAAQRNLNKEMAGGVPALTAEQKALATYRIIVQDTKLAQGDFARTSGGLANQQRILRAELANVEETIGTALMPTVTKLVRHITEWLEKGEKTGSLQRQINAAVLTGSQVIGEMARGMKTAFDTANRVAGVFGGWKKTLELVGAGWVTYKAAMFGAMAATRIQAILTAGTIKAAMISTGIGALIVAAGLAATLIIQHWSKVKKWIQEFGGWMKGSFQVAWDAIKGGAYEAASRLLQVFSFSIRKILELASHLPFGLGKPAQAALNKIDDMIQHLHDQGQRSFGQMGTDWGNALGKSLSSSTDQWINSVAGKLRAAQYAAGHWEGNTFVTGTAAAPATTGSGAPGDAGNRKITGASGSVVGAAGQGGTVASAALTQRNVPYSWGGGGSHGASRGIGRGANTVGFDCSGLAQYALAKVGVIIPRTSEEQWARAPYKFHSLSEALPGDLVFYHGSHPGHVAVYIGGGRVVHAPHTGTVVQIASVNMYPIVGFGRWWGGKTLKGGGGQPAAPAAAVDLGGGIPSLTVGSTPKKAAKPGTPALVPQALLNRISMFASQASARGNTGAAAKRYLQDEESALKLEERLLEQDLAKAKGKARDQISKKLTEVRIQIREVHRKILDAVVITGDALLPRSLRAKLAALQSEFKAESSMASVLTGKAAEEYSARMLVNMRGQAATYASEVVALNARLRRSSGRQRAAVRDELAKVKDALAAVNEQVLAALQANVQTAQGNFSTVFGPVRARMVAQFEAATQKLVDALGAQFFQGGALTPAELALKAFQDAQQQKSLSDALANATTPEERQAAQEAIDLDRLQAAATAERAAADKAYADATQRLQEERAVKEQAMNDALDAFEESVLNGTGSVTDLDAIAAAYGVTITEQAIPEMESLTDATATLAQAFRDLAWWIFKLTGNAPGAESGGAGNPTGPNGDSVWTDPNWWRPGLARGGKLPGRYVGRADTMMYRGTPGETVVDRRLTSALEDAFLGGGRGSSPALVIENLTVIGTTPEQVRNGLAKAVRSASVTGYDLERR